MNFEVPYKRSGKPKKVQHDLIAAVALTPQCFDFFAHSLRTGLT